jgi:hypothetical protein
MVVGAEFAVAWQLAVSHVGSGEPLVVVAGAGEVHSENKMKNKIVSMYTHW